jgi:hypothetical protein
MSHPWCMRGMETNVAEFNHQAIKAGLASPACPEVRLLPSSSFGGPGPPWLALRRRVHPSPLLAAQASQALHAGPGGASRVAPALISSSETVARPAWRTTHSAQQVPGCLQVLEAIRAIVQDATRVERQVEQVYGQPGTSSPRTAS